LCSEYFDKDGEEIRKIRIEEDEEDEEEDIN